MNTILSNIHNDVCFCLKLFEKQIKDKQIRHFFIKSNRILFDTNRLKQYLSETEIKNTILLKDIVDRSVRAIELNNTELYDLIAEKQQFEYIRIDGERISYATKSENAIEVFIEDGNYTTWLNQNFAHKCNQILNFITAFYPTILQPPPPTKLEKKAILLLHHYWGEHDSSKRITEYNVREIANNYNVSPKALTEAFNAELPKIPLIEPNTNRRKAFKKHYESILPILEIKCPQAFNKANTDYRNLI